MLTDAVVNEEDRSLVAPCRELIAPGSGGPPCFYLEHWWMAFVNPQFVQLAAFSRLLSRCYLWSYRFALLGLLCADETSSA